MVKLEIKREYVILLVVAASFLAVSIVLAYGTNSPSVLGHSAGEIEGVAPNCLTIGSPTCDAMTFAYKKDTAFAAAAAWNSNYLGGRNSSQYCWSDGTHCSSLSTSIEEGPEILIGSSTASSSHYTQYEIKEYSYVGIKQVRFRTTARSHGDQCQVGLDIICDASNNFQCSCEGSAVNGYAIGPVDCIFPRNWDSFTIVPHVRGAGNSELLNNGFEKIIVDYCDGSGDSGTSTFDIYVTPYVARINGKRIMPHLKGL